MYIYYIYIKQDLFRRNKMEKAIQRETNGKCF